MAETFGFFASIGDDRVYTDKEFSNYFNKFIKTGFLNNQAGDSLFVKADGTDTIKVSAGGAWIEGRTYENTEDLSLRINPFDPLLDRIDAVAIRCDYIKREIRAVIVEGTPSANPVAPKPTRNEDCYELFIATYKLHRGTISLTQREITDTRYDLDLCGEAVSLIDKHTLREFCKIAGFVMQGDIQCKNIIPTDASQFDLGSQDKPFKKIYADDISFGAGVNGPFLKLTGGTVTGQLTVNNNINSRNIIPNSEKRYDLGSLAKAFNKLYVHDIECYGTAPFISTKKDSTTTGKIKMTPTMRNNTTALEVKTTWGSANICKSDANGDIGHEFDGDGDFVVLNNQSIMGELNVTGFTIEGTRISIDVDEPLNPQDGDIWFKPTLAP